MLNIMLGKQMQLILDFFKSDLYLIILFILIIILFILYISSVEKLAKLRKGYSKFMEKLGNGNNLEEILKAYIKNVQDVEKKNQEIISYCQRLDNNMEKCIQKIGIVRYNAFKDTGSDLSFTLALLDEKNNGIVLNGIYARDTSNIYAKPIENGKSKYVLSEEEKQAIQQAIKQ